MELTCPKCHGTMRTYERNGVHVDQCADCRGIFLDRGELDRLIDAENSWHGDSGKTASGHQASGHQQSRPADAGLGAVVGEVLAQVRGSKQHSDRDHYSDREYSDRRYPKKKKESFLGDLFG